jgi:hypothetical protein
MLVDYNWSCVRLFMKSLCGDGMKKKFNLFLILGIIFNLGSMQYVAAMGSKNILLDETPSKEKLKKIDELFSLFHFDQITLESILFPFENELKIFGFPEKPFAKTIQKLKTLTNELTNPLQELLKDFYVRMYQKSFTEQELSDLINFYKKPVIEKENKLIVNSVVDICIEPIILACKDPKIFAEFFGELLPEFSRGFAEGLVKKTSGSGREISQGSPKMQKHQSMQLRILLSEEIETFKNNDTIYTDEFLENLKKRYVGLAPTLDTYFGKAITKIKMTELSDYLLEKADLYMRNSARNSFPMPKKDKISDTKNALIQELVQKIEKNYKPTFADNLIKSLEREFKELGLSLMPFKKSIHEITRKLDAYDLDDDTSIVNFYNKYFSEEELKERIQLEKNTLLSKLMNKHDGIFWGSNFFPVFIDILKDKNLFEKYETQITLFKKSTNEKSLEKMGMELAEIAFQEFKVFSIFVKSNSEAIKINLKNQFPGVSSLVITLLENDVASRFF